MIRFRRITSMFVPVAVAAALLVPTSPASADPEPSPAAPSSRAEIARQTFDRAKSVFDGEAKGPTGRDATLLLRDLIVLGDELTTTQRAEVTRWKTLGGANQRATKCGENVKFVIHCVDAPSGFNGTDVLRAFARSHGKYTGAGYKGALADRAGVTGGRPGPNPNRKTDIYVGNWGAGLYGFCTTDAEKVNIGASVPAWCAVNTDYSWSGLANIRAMQVTAAHEYFHAVQFAYDVTEDGWMMESTATWAEDEVYDGINDNYNYLSWSPLTRPALPMAKFGDIHYGTWIFWRYLSERLTARQNGMETVVRGVIRASDPAGVHSLGALKKVLADRGKKLPGIFQAFTDANRRPVRTYEEGKHYPTKPLAGSVKLNGPGSAKQWGPIMPQLSSRTFQFRPTGTHRQNKLRIAVNLPPRFKNGTAVVSTYHKDGKVFTAPVSLNRDGNGVKKVPFAAGRISRVEVTLNNASSAMKGCWDGNWSSPWTCYGAPVHNSMKGVVNGKVFR